MVRYRAWWGGQKEKEEDGKEGGGQGESETRRGGGKPGEKKGSGKGRRRRMGDRRRRRNSRSSIRIKACTTLATTLAPYHHPRRTVPHGRPEALESAARQRFQVLVLRGGGREGEI